MTPKRSEPTRRPPRIQADPVSEGSLMPSSLGRRPAGGRPPKHPWDEIENIYIYGEDVEKPGRGGASVRCHEWPTQTMLVERFHLRLDTLSKRLALKNTAGKTAHDRRDDFRADYLRQLDAKLAGELAGRETGFRVATFAAAELGLSQITLQLSKPQGGDGLAKLLTAAKKAQELGMVALDRPADGPNAGAPGVEDWTLMREVRRGAKLVQEGSGTG